MTDIPEDADEVEARQIEDMIELLSNLKEEHRRIDMEIKALEEVGVVDVLNQFAPVRVGLGRLLNDRHQGGLPQMQVVFASAAHVAQDVAAAVGLFADQRGVFAQVGAVIELFDQLCAGQFDGGQWRAQLMRGGGNNAPQIS